MRKASSGFGMGLVLIVLTSLLLVACGDSTATAVLSTTTAAPTTLATTLATTTVPTTTTPTTSVASTTAAPTATTVAPTTAVSTLPQLIFVGNSIVNGLGLSSTDNFPYQTWQLLGMNSYELKNMSSPREATTSLIINSSDKIDVLYSSARKNIIVVMEGVNDWASGNSSEKAYQNLVDYCKGRKDKGFKVVIVTPIGLTGTPLAGYDKHQEYVNTAIRKNWPSFADAVADAGADPNIGKIRTDITEYYQADGRHLSIKGAGVLAQIVKDAILKI